MSDFGLSRFMGRINSQQGPCGTTQWMAPEVIEGKVYNEISDVFSFGVNLWELVTRRIPWEGVEVDAIRKAVVRGQRLSLDYVGLPARPRRAHAALLARGLRAPAQVCGHRQGA